MTGEPWKASIARLSEPLYRLALLLTDSHPGAEAATRAAIRAVPPETPPAAVEDALLRALLTHPPRRRLGRRRAVLPRSLHLIDARDRFVLGAWLLRQIDGRRLAAITGESSDKIVERLTLLIEQAIPDDAPQPDDSGAHPTLAQWLAAQLGITQPPEHPLLCPRCHEQQRGWNAAIATWRARLREAVGHESLPASIVAAIGETSTDPTHRPARWRRPAFLGTVGVIALLGLLLFAPGSGGQASTATQRSAQELVRDALRAWSRTPEQGTLYRQVWARSAGGNGSAMITDLWLSDAATSRHRIAVQRDNQLVEWQVLDGNRFYYGAEPEHSSCQWNTAWSGSRMALERGALAFRVSREDAHAVTVARLEQGALGLGHAVLRAALSAADLRSFGTRVQGEQSLAVVAYTDRHSDPPRQIVLWIDPATDQLHRVQEVTHAEAQAATRDLWRLEKRQQFETGVPLELPRWPRGGERDRLLDPGCPSLKLDHVVSLRSLLAAPWQWYVPRTMPSGVTQAVLTSPTPLGGMQPGAPGGILADGRIMLAGPGRHVSIGFASLQPEGESSREIERGAWRVGISASSHDSARRITLRRAHATAQEQAPMIEVRALGFTDDELLQFVDSLIPVAPDTWRELNQRFIDPRPLQADVALALERALAATEPRPGTTTHTIARTSVRVLPAPESRGDPYHVPRRLIQPTTLIREQWLRRNDSGAVEVRDQQTLPDGTLYQLLQHDATRFYWYSSLEGRAWTGSTGLLTPILQTKPVVWNEIIGLLADGSPIRAETHGDLLLLEQALDRPLDSLWDGWAGPVAPQRPDLSRMPPGSALRRVWLDRATSLPARSEVIHRASNGIETTVSGTLIERQATVNQAAVDFSAAPSLPDDVLTFQVSDDGSESTIIDSAPSAVTRVLAWTDAPGMVVLRTALPETTTLTPGGMPVVRWDHLAAAPFAHVTQYELEPPAATPTGSITVTQGPRSLLRYVLRYGLPTGMAGGGQWTTSRSISALIDGEPRDVWLLEDADLSVLVFEIDELLVHITGQRDYLRGALLDRLPTLTWNDPWRIIGRMPLGPRDRIVVEPSP